MDRGYLKNKGSDTRQTTGPHRCLTQPMNSMPLCSSGGRLLDQTPTSAQRNLGLEQLRNLFCAGPWSGPIGRTIRYTCFRLEAGIDFPGAAKA